MADEIDTDYGGAAARLPTRDELLAALRAGRLPPPHYDLVERDGQRRLVHARGGWYLLDEETQQPDFSQPVDPPPRRGKRPSP